MTFAACSGDDTDGMANPDGGPGSDTGTTGMDTSVPGMDGSVVTGPDGGGTLADGAVILPDGRVIVLPRDGGAPLGLGACSDGMDNDGDGLIDGEDPECTGPFDNDESSFATGIPGDNRDPVWQDCFFDGNSGAGDDGCRYHTDCLYDPMTSRDCSLSAECLEFCRPRVPNGCDCFGCCEIFRDDGTSTTVAIGSECSVDLIDDPVACPPCVQTMECINTCGMCELCPGRTVEDLPPECFVTPDGGMPGTDGGTPPPPPMCEDGIACDMANPCPTPDQYCQLGCCMTLLI